MKYIKIVLGLILLMVGSSHAIKCHVCADYIQIPKIIAIEDTVVTYLIKTLKANYGYNGVVSEEECPSPPGGNITATSASTDGTEATAADIITTEAPATTLAAKKRQVHTLFKKDIAENCASCAVQIWSRCGNGNKSQYIKMRFCLKVYDEKAKFEGCKDAPNKNGFNIQNCQCSADKCNGKELDKGSKTIKCGGDGSEGSVRGGGDGSGHRFQQMSLLGYVLIVSILMTM